MNKLQQQAAANINQHLKHMRQLQPRQFPIEQFNSAVEWFAGSMAETFLLANPGLNREEFIRVCTEGV